MEELNLKPTNINPSSCWEEDFNLGPLDRNPSPYPLGHSASLQFLRFQFIWLLLRHAWCRKFRQFAIFDLLIELCIDLKGTIGKTICVRRTWISLYLLNCMVVFCIEFCVLISCMQKYPLNLFPYPQSLRSKHAETMIWLWYIHSKFGNCLLTLHLFPQAEVRDGGHCSPRGCARSSLTGKSA